MELIPISFLAGVLTVLAPCILPLLPIIIGGSLDNDHTSIKRPLIITASLAISIVVFTLLLKVSTAFINIPDSFWSYFSGIIILIFAVTLLFPDTWAEITNRISHGKLEQDSQKLMYKMFKKEGTGAAIILGTAMGPVFASCSPTYFLILGTVLPASYAIGLINLFAYAIGLAVVMLLIAFLGKRVMKFMNIAANPKGLFKRILGILFLIVGISIIFGLDKKLETYIIDRGYFGITTLEENLIQDFEL
ncbi:MAG: sulfite exporter TauE/SafE family protein [Candidatus Pacebacteria bacterium]|nr:sulfite exporter TauE/SafE family protein [Candidatus Paceibacterota bacterium]